MDQQQIDAMWEQYAKRVHEKFTMLSEKRASAIKRLAKAMGCTVKRDRLVGGAVEAYNLTVTAPDKETMDKFKAAATERMLINAPYAWMEAPKGISRRGQT